MVLRACLGVVLAMSAIGMSACQSAAQETPAVLVSADAETLARVRSVLAGAMNRSSVELGPGDLTQTSTISVLPPGLGPLEGRSTVVPAQFSLVLRGGRCLARRQDTGEAFDLAGVACRPLSRAP